MMAKITETLEARGLVPQSDIYALWKARALIILQEESEAREARVISTAAFEQFKAALGVETEEVLTSRAKQYKKRKIRQFLARRTKSPHSPSRRLQTNPLA